MPMRFRTVNRGGRTSPSRLATGGDERRCAVVRPPAAVRYILLDRVTELRPPELARGVKCVSLSDDVFADHFPGAPVMPGALVIEAMAQLGGLLLEATLGARGHEDLYAVLVMVERAKLRRMVHPGDRLELEAQGVSASETDGRVRVLARVEAATVAEAELSFALAPLTDERVIAHRREVRRIWLRGEE